MAKDKWSDAKTDYVTSSLSYRQIADKHGLSYDRVAHVAAEEDWSRDRQEYSIKVAREKYKIAAKKEAERYKRSLETSDELTEEIHAAIRDAKKSGEHLSARDVKAYSSALRDLKELRGEKTMLDIEEQIERINKLKRDTEREDGGAKQITVKIEGGGEWAN